MAMALVLSLAAPGAFAQQACTVDLECEDGNTCTIDTCPAGHCVRTPDVAACGPVIEHMLAAKKMKLRVPGGNPIARGARMLTTDGAFNPGNLPDPLSLSDPVSRGGSLRIFSTVEGFDRTYALPYLQWDYFPENQPGDDGGYQYRDNQNTYSPIGMVEIRAGTIMKAKGKGQDVLTQMDFTLATNPSPVGVILALGSNRYCFSMGIVAGSVIEKYNPSSLYFAKLTPAPASCPCAVGSDCDDGQACSGTETCGGGYCQAGGGSCP
jgi:hypothetical protein